MSKATISYCGVELDCTYDYTPAEQQTWTDHGYPAMAEISSVKVGGVEIWQMLDNAQIEAIETLILEERGEQDADAAREYLFERQQERAMEEQYP